MKSLVLVLVWLALATIAVARPRIDSGDSNQIDRAAYESCLTKFFTDANNALRGYSSSFNVDKHFLCFSKSLGWQNADGALNKSVIAANVEKSLGHEKAERFKNECVVEYPTPEKTAGHLFNCAKNFAPQSTWLR